MKPRFILKHNLPLSLVTASLLLSACSSGTQQAAQTSPAQTSNAPSALIQTQAAPTGALNRGEWRLRAVPAGVGNASAVLDGDPGTSFVTPGAQNNAMALQLDLGSVQIFDGLVLETASPNYLRSYNLYVSSDPGTWGPWVAGGSKLGSGRLDARFPAQTGRYVTLQVGQDRVTQPWNLAELWLTSSAGGNPTPSPTTDTPTNGSRDAWLWPFSAQSIWNTPIGAGASYALPGYFKPGSAHTADTEYFFKLRASDPLKTIYGVPNWTDRCSDTSQPQRNPDGSPVQVHFPSDFVLGGVTGGSTPNAVTTLLQPDGQTLIGLEPLARCAVNGDVFGYVKNDSGNETLSGTGLYGGHWGSGLSGFGGSLRYGELTGAAPIHHPLKINVPGDYLHYEAGNPETKVGGVVLEGKGYRWPADRNDAGAPGNYKASSAFRAAKMGALLAIPASVNLQALSLKTPSARKLAQALQDYGAYIVDDAGPVVSVAAGGQYDYAQLSFSVQREAEGEFREAFGYDFSQQSNATGPARDWFSDFGKLVTALAIVDNNGPSSIGGPGARRITAALPPIGAADSQAPSTPSGLRPVGSDTSSVSLAWNAASDNVGVIRYDVLDGSTLLGSSYGQTRLRIGNLQPNTRLRARVVAYDSSLNPSGGSSVLAVSSKDGYVENFEPSSSGTGAPGWAQDNAVSLDYGQLRLNGWARSPLSVLYGARSFSAPYTLSFSTRTDAADDNGKHRVLFGASDIRNTLMLEFGGGAKNTVVLKKRVAGADSVLATYAGHYDINREEATIELSVKAGAVSVKASGGRGNVTLFSGVPVGSSGSGSVGFEQLGTQSFVDNLTLTLE